MSTSDPPEAGAGVPGHSSPATSCPWGTQTSPAPVPLPSGPLQPVPSSRWGWLGDNSTEPTCLNRVLHARPSSSLTPPAARPSSDRAAMTIHTSQLRKLGSRDRPSPRATQLLDGEPTPTPVSTVLLCSDTRACPLPWAHVRPAEARSQGLLGQAGHSLPCPAVSSKPVPRPPRGDWQVMAPHFPKDQIKLREGTTLGQTLTARMQAGSRIGPESRASLGALVCLQFLQFFQLSLAAALGSPLRGGETGKVPQRLARAPSPGGCGEQPAGDAGYFKPHSGRLLPHQEGSPGPLPASPRPQRRPWQAQGAASPGWADLPSP